MTSAESVEDERERVEPHIGTLNEKPLHAALKVWYAEEGDRFEVPLDGFVIDIVRDRLLIEIQTGSVSALRRKLTALVKRHPIRLVIPIAATRSIVKLDDEGTEQAHRRSPKHGRMYDVFSELVALPRLLGDSNLQVEVLLIQEEEVRRRSETHGWRRHGWVTDERRLVEVIDQVCFHHPADFLAIVPPSLAEPFTTADLAVAVSCPRRLAQQMAYCLRKMGVITVVGKKGNALCYKRSLFANAPDED